MVSYTPRYGLPYPATGDGVKPQSRDFVDLANLVDVAIDEVANRANPTALYGTEDPMELSDDPKYYEVRSAAVATTLGMPTNTTGILTQWHLGTITLQQWVVAEGQRQIWLRSRRSPGAWSAWELVAPYAPGPESNGSTGMKRVPLAFALPAATDAQSVTAGSSRWVRRWAHMPSRVRVHLSNRNPANMINGGAANLLGAKMGVAQDDGSMADMVDIFPTGAIPTDGTELVSEWMDCPGTDGDALGITLGWNGGTSQQLLDSGGWTQVTSDGWDAPTVTGWLRKVAMPFYLWVEAEVPASVPTVAGLGDSITVGRATSDPVQDSWLAVYARSQGALPVFFAQSGSSMIHWAVTDVRWTSFYPGLSFTPDALMFALGQNNMLAGQTLAQHQTRFSNVRGAYSTFWPNVPVYLCGVTPSSSKLGDIRAVRLAFNEWLKTLPNGERGYFDFPAAVGDATDSELRPEFAGDNLHPNTAGHEAMAALLKARPVTPVVVDGAEVARVSKRVDSIGYDSGWRDITGSLAEAPKAGKLLIRRTGNIVHMQLDGLTYASNASFKSWGPVVTAGFRPPFELDFSAGRRLVSDTGGAIRINRTTGNGFAYQVVADLAIRAIGSWVTDESTPTTLPGTPA